ncbi:hypothetical protein AAFC00_006238 [Neodothiora populina]
MYRYSFFERYGVVQLNPLEASDEESLPDDDCEFPIRGPPMTTCPVPGRRCPTCNAKGDVVWVIPGKKCPKCGTAVN